MAAGKDALISDLLWEEEVKDQAQLNYKNNKAPEKVGFSTWVRALYLKLQYFGHLMRRTDSLEKTLMLGKIEGRRRRG